MHPLLQNCICRGRQAARKTTQEIISGHAKQSNWKIYIQVRASNDRHRLERVSLYVVRQHSAANFGLHVPPIAPLGRTAIPVGNALFRGQKLPGSHAVASTDELQMWHAAAKTCAESTASPCTQCGRARVICILHEIVQKATKKAALIYTRKFAGRCNNPSAWPSESNQEAGGPRQHLSSRQWMVNATTSCCSPTYTCPLTTVGTSHVIPLSIFELT